MKNVFLTMLVLCLVAGIQADMFFTVSEDMDGGEGYMNVFETDGTTYLWGSPWANLDLRATSSGSDAGGDFQVLLQANTNGYDDNLTDPYWVIQPSGPGNKSMEANYYTEVDDLDGETIKFQYKVLSNDLTASMQNTAGFIKVLDAGGGWATTQEVYSDLSVGLHSLTLNVSTGSDPRVQCGFVIKGINVSSSDPIADLGIVVVPFRDRATTPDPGDGDDVSLSLASLSWAAADPNNPVDTITYDVYVDTEPNFIDPDTYTASGITNTEVNLIDLLPSPGLTLEEGPTYYWYVDSTDPHGDPNGKPLTTSSEVWTFQVGDIAPVVNAGLNQYVYVDGSNEGTFTLSGSFTDDGASQIDLVEYVTDWNLNQTGPDSEISIGAVSIEYPLGTPISAPFPMTAGTTAYVTVDVTVSSTNPLVTPNGWYYFQLEVTDAGANLGVDEGNNNPAPHDEFGVRAGVYDTCAEAAIEDPADSWDTTGDLDGDCDKDLADFALLAAGWLDCNAAKTTCPQ